MAFFKGALMKTPRMPGNDESVRIQGPKYVYLYQISRVPCFRVPRLRKLNLGPLVWTPIHTKKPMYVYLSISIYMIFVHIYLSSSN